MSSGSGSGSGSAFVEVASLSDLREEGISCVTVENGCVQHRVALIYDDDEGEGEGGVEVHAVSDVCTHAGASLYEGGLGRDGTLRCPRHGAPFDPRTGEALGYPATEDLRTYETKVEGGVVYVRVNEDR